MNNNNENKTIKNELPYITIDRIKESAYYIVPKQLFKDKRFSGLSTDAILLYAALKDRVQLSQKNKWIDQDGHVYIIYTREDVTEEFGWKKDKVIKLFKQLTEYGLIEEIMQTGKRANLIYVKTYLTYNEPKKDSSSKESTQVDNKSTQKNKVGKTEYKKVDSRKNRPQECVMVGKTDPSNTENINNTKINNLSINTMSKLIKHNMDYDCLKEDDRCKTYIDSIFNVIIDVLATEGDLYYFSSKESKNLQIVKNQMMKLNALHIQHVCNNLSLHPQRLHAPSKYIAKALYEATLTLNLQVEQAFKQDQIA